MILAALDGSGRDLRVMLVMVAGRDGSEPG